MSRWFVFRSNWATNKFSKLLITRSCARRHIYLMFEAGFLLKTGTSYDGQRARSMSGAGRGGVTGRHRRLETTSVDIIVLD